jgi:hypothetical protein
VVKRWKRHAPEQEAVLKAFEAAGWPECILDPLDAADGLDAKERLRETVKSLNKKLTPGTIRFHANGNGGGRWEIVKKEENAQNPRTTPGQGEDEVVK